MPEYVYKGRSRSNNEPVTGTILADTEEQAKARLRATVILTSIGEKKFKQVTKKVPLKEVGIFSRQLAILVRSGIGLLESLETMLKQTTNPVFEEILRGLATEVRGGASFSQALARYPNVFPEIFVGMVEAGEESGNMPTMLLRLSEYYEGQIKLQSKIRSATSYPKFVMGFALLATLAIFIFIFPRFEAIYRSMKAPLPMITRVFLGISKGLRATWPGLLALGVGAVFGLRYLDTKREFRKWKDDLLLKIPIFGPLMRKVVISRFTKTLAVLVGSGVRIETAVKVAAKATGNLPFQDVSDDIAKGLKEGQGISRPLQEKVRYFPPMAIQMLSVGEKAGRESLVQMLNEVAGLNEGEVEEGTQKLSSSLEPILIGVLGGIVAMVMLSLYLPMFSVVRIISAQR